MKANFALPHLMLFSCYLFILLSAPCTVPPSDKDVEVAFTLADADMSGLVDFDEFAKLYKLIKVRWGEHRSKVYLSQYESMYLMF